MAVMSLPPELPGASEQPTPAVAKARRSLKVYGGHVRAKTIPPTRLDEDEQREADASGYPGDVDRPATREQCGQMKRPCPFVSCSHHLYLDVSPTTGAIKLNFPHLEPWEIAETCSLDVADRGGATLEEIGAIYNLTRERIRQYETMALRKIRKADDGSLGLPPEREEYTGAKGPRPGYP